MLCDYKSYTVDLVKSKYVLSNILILTMYKITFDKGYNNANMSDVWLTLKAKNNLLTFCNNISSYQVNYTFLYWHEFS